MTVRPPCTALNVPKTVVLIGMMGSGKTAVGRRLAKRLNLPFVDADAEIEAAAGCSIRDIFELHGEAAFRAGERRIMARLLDQPVRILAAGGGAFIDPDTRAQIAAKGISVWLKADKEALIRRLRKRSMNRPLLHTKNPSAAIERLMAEREPIYALADITVESVDGSTEDTVTRVLKALENYLRKRGQMVS